LGTPAIEVETWEEAKVHDYWNAFLENKGIKVKSWKQEAKELGFTKEEIERYKKAIM